MVKRGDINYEWAIKFVSNISEVMPFDFYASCIWDKMYVSRKDNVTPDLIVCFEDVTWPFHMEKPTIIKKKQYLTW